MPEPIVLVWFAVQKDPAQNVCSSQCLTVMEVTGANHDDLYVSCTMPSLEVGTIGGGTVLPPQSACLQVPTLQCCQLVCVHCSANLSSLV